MEQPNTTFDSPQCGSVASSSPIYGAISSDKTLPIWVETKTKDNKIYYYNSTTKETTWKKPENVRIVKYEEMVKHPPSSTTSSSTYSYVQSSSHPVSSSDYPHQMSPVANPSLLLSKPVLGAPGPVNVAALLPQPNPINFLPLTQPPPTLGMLQQPPPLGILPPQLATILPQPQLNIITQRPPSLSLQPQPVVEQQQQQQQLNASSSSTSIAPGSTKSRPVSTTPVPGTPWCIVWTDKNKVFFFNPSTKTSVWERPAELRNRDDVDKLINGNPNSSTTPSQADGDSQTPDGDQSPTQVEKKLKLDNNQSCSSTNSSAAPARTMIAPKIVKKEVISEVEKEAAKKRETIPFEERVQTFRKMLEEKEVNATSTFQKELSKIVFDPRYLLLTSNERREVFEKYCLEKTEDERRKKRERMKKATDDFKALLTEANLTSSSIYDEFHAQYSKDPRYRGLERTKDREILFDDHLAMLRRKERDERPVVKPRLERRPSPRGISREEAEDIYQALLIELISDPDMSWGDAKRIMRRSPQWVYVEDLPREWREAIFERHLDKIYQRRREKFHQLLNETKEITLSSDWRDIRRIIRDDPRYIKFATSDRRCEREFRDFIRKKRSYAEVDFRQLLRETKLIDKDTRRKIEESEHQHLIDIIGTLQNDRRYVILEPFSEERRKILLSYIEELATTAQVDQAQTKTSPETRCNRSPEHDSAKQQIEPSTESLTPREDTNNNGEGNQDVVNNSGVGDEMDNECAVSKEIEDCSVSE